MLKTIEISRAAKTRGCAATYRAGDQSVFDTCPKDCNLNPSWCGSDMPDLVYMASVLNAKPRAGESMTYSHFHPKWYKELLGPDKTVINFSADSFQQAVRWIKRGQPAVSIVDESDLQPNIWTISFVLIAGTVSRYVHGAIVIIR